MSTVSAAYAYEDANLRLRTGATDILASDELVIFLDHRILDEAHDEKFTLSKVLTVRGTIRFVNPHMIQPVL